MKAKVKSTLRGTLGILLALTMLLGIMPITAMAKPIENKKVTVTYPCDDKDVQQDFYYSDSYFNKSGYTFRQDLAQASLALALAAGHLNDTVLNKKPEVEGTKSFEKFAKDLGMKDVEFNRDRTNTPGNNTIGVSMANKKVTDDKGEATLLMVGIRGFGYRSEWGGNVYLAESGDHKGFALCRDNTLSFMKKYIRENNIEGRIKVWVSGYSRAGVATNMVGGALDDGYNLGKKVSLDPDDMYIYANEPPMGSVTSEVKDAKYDNIHNIVNPDDYVTWVGFRAWDFCRYGVDHYMPTKHNGDLDTYHSDLMKMYTSLPNETENQYGPDTYKEFGNSGKDVYTFYKNLDKAITTGLASSRKDYVDNLEMDLVDLVGAIMSVYDYGTEAMLDPFIEKVQENPMAFLGALTNMNESVLDSYLELFVDGLRDAGYTEMQQGQITRLVHNILPRVAKMATQYPDTTIALVLNLNMIGYNHAAAACSAWLKTLPEDYLTSHVGYSYNL